MPNSFLEEMQANAKDFADDFDKEKNQQEEPVKDKVTGILTIDDDFEDDDGPDFDGRHDPENDH